MRILLVEDDQALGSSIITGLKHYGYTADWLKDGQTALSVIKSEEAFDVVILDLNLPRLSGSSVLKKVRDLDIKTPILILTAHDSIENRVNHLNNGADDFLSKPFDLDELSARIQVLHRRSSNNRAKPSLNYRHITLDPSTFSVTVHEQPVNLSRREFFLLQKLLEKAGHVVTRETLNQNLYGWNDDIDSNTLEVHVHNLRKKLSANFIRTIRGIGYMAEKAE